VSRRTPLRPSKRLISAVETSAPSSMFSSDALEVTWLPAIYRLDTLAEPETSRLYPGPDVPIPRRDVALSHHRLLLPDIEVEPVKNDTWLATPEPDMVAVPCVSVSAAQYQTEADEFHLRI